MVTPDPITPSALVRGFLREVALVALLLGTLGLRAWAEPSFHAELAPDSVGAGDSAMLRLVFTDLGDVEAPTLPAVTNATIRYQGVSQQISIVNFTRSTSLIHQYQVQAQNPGLVQIPGIGGGGRGPDLHQRAADASGGTGVRPVPHRIPATGGATT